MLNRIRKFILYRIPRPLFTNQIIQQENVCIGEYTYGEPIIRMFSHQYKIIIGKFCSIGWNVQIIVDGNNITDWISTYPFYKLSKNIPKNPGNMAGKGDIVIGNDVWIGCDVIILPGVKIGDGAIVGAGSVVTKNVDDYELVAGNPACHIRYRFDKEEIIILKNIQWWNWPIEKIIENHELLQSTNIKEFLKN